MVRRTNTPPQRKEGDIVLGASFQLTILTLYAEWQLKRESKRTGWVQERKPIYTAARQNKMNKQSKTILSPWSHVSSTTSISKAPVPTVVRKPIWFLDKISVLSGFSSALSYVLATQWTADLRTLPHWGRCRDIADSRKLAIVSMIFFLLCICCTWGSRSSVLHLLECTPGLRFAPLLRPWSTTSRDLPFPRGCNLVSRVDPGTPLIWLEVL